MKIARIEIENLKSIRQASISAHDVLAIVGRNNSGKSTVMQALTFFFNPTKRLLDADWFPNHDTTLTIKIQLDFDDLSDWEKESLSSWLSEGGENLVLSREVSWNEGDFDVATVAHVDVPKAAWLRGDQISAENIEQWWRAREELRVGNLDFGGGLGDARPAVGAWKTAAAEFIAAHGDQIPYKAERLVNPRGATNVLKGALPEFILVPAVRDVHDELKVTQTNPFGRLIHALLDRITTDVKEELSAQIESLAGRLNRVGGQERLNGIVALEDRLNELMRDLMDCDLEIEMRLPSLQQVFGEARIMADDGVRTAIDQNGHGMQRSMILTILRFYAEFSGREKAGDRADERSTIIAIEEPELYMHPQSQRTLMGVLRQIAEGRDQIVYTTHSSLFVDISRFDDLCIMRRTGQGDDLSATPTQLTMAMMVEDLKARKGVQADARGMREQYSHVFDPRINEGFFADKVVIVEGPSEEYAFPIYSRLLGFDLDRQNVAVVHGHGKGSMDRLARVFSGLGIPVFLWFDGDRSNADPRVTDKTIELLDLVGAPVDNISEVGTAVGGRHAVLEEEFEATLRQELPKYDDWVAECAGTIGPSGKPLKHRFVAHRVAAEVDRGAPPRDTVPATVAAIVDAVEVLTTSDSLLHGSAEALRPRR